MVDLSLVPMDELIGEAEKRCTEFVCAYYPNDFQSKKEMQFRYNKGNWDRACALATILHNDVLNNWNGELKLLQDLNDNSE